MSAAPFSFLRRSGILLFLLGVLSTGDVLAQCLAEYTVAADVGDTIREGNPVTFTFTPTAGAGLSGCGATSVAVNFSLSFSGDSEATENDFSSTGNGFIWETGDDPLQPFDVVSTPESDLLLEVSELTDLTVSVSAIITGNGSPVQASISGDNAFSFTVLDPNKNPVLTPFDAPSVTEDDLTVALGSAAEVSDENEDPQTLTITVTGGTVTTGADDVTFGGDGNGTASFTLSGTLDALNTALDAATYTPTPDLSGTNVATIAIDADDGFGGSASTSVTFSIAHVADTPSVTDATTLEDNQNTGGLVISRADVDGAEITHFRVSGIVGGTVYLNDGETQVADGSFVTAANGAAGLRFLPDTDRVEDGSFDVEASLSADASGIGGDPVTATIQITPVNDAPSFTVGADIEVNEDSGVHSTAAWATNLSPGPADEAAQTHTFNVAADDPDLFADGPAIDGVTGELTFTPALHANGSTTVTVSLTDTGGTANDGEDTSADQTFTIDIVAVNDAPVVTMPGTQTMLEDGELMLSPSIADLDAADSDVEVTVTATSHVTLSGTAGLSFSEGTGTADETMTFQGTLADVNAALTGLTFVPTQDAVEGASLTVSVDDLGNTGLGGNLTDSGTTTINLTPVNDAPSFTSGGDVTVDEDSGAHMTAGWASNRSPGPADEAAQELSFSVAADVPALFSVQPAIDGTTGDLTFTPALNANGTTEVTVSVSDTGGTANDGENSSPDQTFTITVTAVNDAPVVTMPGTQTMLEDGQLKLSPSIADLDAGGSAVEVTVVATSHVTLSGDAGLTFSEGDGTADETMTFQGNLTDVNAALTDLTFVPTQDAVVGASLTVSVDDLNHTGTGGNLTDSGTTTINLTPVNDAPSFTKGSDITVDEDSGAHTTPAWATNLSKGPADESAQNLTFHLSNDNNGLFAVPPAIDGTTGDLTFTPALNANGTATVTISLMDDGGTANGGADMAPDQTFTITLDAVNDAPVITLPPSQSTAEDTPLILSTGNGNVITIEDVDSGNDDLEVTMTATSTLTLSGTAGLTFTVGDGDEDVTMTFRGALADINAALDGLSYMMAPNQVSGASLSMDVSDLGNNGSGGPLEDTATLPITIGDVNDPPSFQKGPDITVLEDAGPQIFSGWAKNIIPGPPDESDQNVTFQVTNGAPTLFADGPSIDPETGDLSFTTAPDANGVTQIWLELQDNGGTSSGGSDISPTQVFSIRVTPVNDAPVVIASDNLTVDENATLVFSAASDQSLTIQDVDADSGTLDVTLGASDNATLSMTAVSGTLAEINAALDGLTFTPHPLENGPALLYVQVSDNGNTGAPGMSSPPLTTEVTIPVAIVPVNSPPIAIEDAYSAFSGVPVVLRPLLNDSDPENDTLEIAAVSQPAGGEATLGQADADGRVTTVRYTPDASFTGSDSFTYEVHDADGASAIATITVAVSGAGPDGDGVDDDVEANAPNGGDGNGDGIPDAEQDNVASFLAEGSASFVTVAVPAGQTLAQTGSPANPSPADFPEGRATPAGFVSYNVNGLQPGASTVVTIHLPEGTDVDGYLKYGPTPDNPEPHWYDFGWDGTTGAQIQGSRIMLHLTDGLRGDDDLTANGVIVDPGAPVLTQNILPVVPDLDGTVEEDSMLSVDLLEGASDADGDPLSVVSVSVASSAPSGPVTGSSGHVVGTLVDGEFDFTPAPDFFGTVLIDYAVSDGQGAPVPARVTVNVTPVQDAPVAVADTATTLMNQAVIFNILENDYDVDGDDIFLTQMDTAPAGQMTFLANGQVTFTPSQDYFGTVQLGYSVSDGAGNSGVFVRGQITIVVEGVPGAPIAVNDSIATPEDTPVSIPVLANDTDVNNDVLAVLSFTQPSNGEVVEDADGALLYTPDPDFNGEDAFSYVPTDGGLNGSAATVTVTVLAVNDAPQFGVESAPILPSPGPLVVQTNGVAMIDGNEPMDVDGDTLTYAWQVSLSEQFDQILFEWRGDSLPFEVVADSILSVFNGAGVLRFPGERLDLWHRLAAWDPDGAEATGAVSSVTFERATSVAAEGAHDVPTEVYLRNNYPNPFNPTTTLEFGLPAPGPVRIAVYDMQGREVRVLVNRDMDAGNHRLQISMSGVASGVYLYRMQAGDRVLVRSMHVLK